jgi:hypothetical protein
MEERIMANWRKAGVSVVLGVIFVALIVGGCATQQTTRQQMVVSEYMLQKAGFKKWGVTNDTPKRAALMANIPKGQITKFEGDGTPYYVYNDPNHNVLYTGDETAYQNYLHLAHGQNLCQVTKGSNNSQFWGCFQEYEQRHKQGLE